MNVKTLKTRFWNLLLGESMLRVVRVKSLVPYVQDGMVRWPTLLCDDRAGQRETKAFGWNKARLIAIFRRGYVGH